MDSTIPYTALIYIAPLSYPQHGMICFASPGLFVADADEPFGPLNDLFVACFGTFLLKEETSGDPKTIGKPWENHGKMVV